MLTIPRAVLKVASFVDEAVSEVDGGLLQVAVVVLALAREVDAATGKETCAARVWVVCRNGTRQEKDRRERQETHCEVNNQELESR